MNDANRVWMMPPWGAGEPEEVEAAPAVLTPLLVAGWSQCAAPGQEEGKTDVHD